MKYIQSYNESVRDQLKPKSNEEIKKLLVGKSLDYILDVTKNDVDWVIDNMILTGDFVPNEREKRDLFYTALKKAKVNTTKRLIDIYGIIPLDNTRLNFIFQQSINTNNMDLFKTCIEFGVRVNKSNSGYMMMAANNNNLEMIKILFEHDVDKDYEILWLRSIIIDEKYYDVVKFLSEKIPSVKSTIKQEYERKKEHIKILERYL